MNILPLAAAWAALLASGASQARTLPVEEMARDADVVGVATVQGSQSRHDPRTGFIYTDHTLKFEEVWKGSPSDPFILMQAGGQVGDQRAAIAGHHFTFRPGERIVVFASPSRLGHHVLIGIRQGLYRIEEGKPHPRVRRDTEARSSMTLAELRAAVARALGKSPDNPPEPAPPPKAPSSGPPAAPAAGTAPQSGGPPVAPAPSPSPPASGRRGPALAAAAVLLAAGAAVLLGFRKRNTKSNSEPS